MMTPEDFARRLTALLNEARGMLNSHIIGELRYHQVQLEAHIHIRTAEHLAAERAAAKKLKALPTAKTKPKRKAVRK